MPGTSELVPGTSELVPGTSELVPGTSELRPGIAADGDCVGAACAGGATPSAAARFCSTCGASAAELTNCCPMLGAGAGGTGSAWAVPDRPPTTNAANEAKTTAVARSNAQMYDMNSPWFSVTGPMVRPMPK